MTRLTAKCQVTIPKRVRDRLGLKPGSDVAFEAAVDGRIYLVAEHEPPKSVFATLRGSAKLALSTDEIMALSRGEEPG
ncbi:MAG TPA: AbrB/MazE/SpoVT family DNA-binding domain-containing protein [Stellaceae bacterium]|nr:AbrB/MazE/SpoVT family DNA-binding domain-containing protein [Stellaceae bacterium]